MTDTLTHDTEPVRRDPAEVTATRRRELAAESLILDAVEKVCADLVGIDKLGEVYACRWYYWEDDDTRLLSDGERRRLALAWLARHARAITAIARLLGSTAPLDKRANEHSFGVSTFIEIGDTGMWKLLEAYVPAALTCELVDTGEVETIPAQTRPVMERRCPPSIFAGIENEVDGYLADRDEAEF